MSALLKALCAHHDAIGLRSLHVPEIDMTIWWHPVTLADRSKIYEGTVDPAVIAARTLVVKALTADGRPAFERAHEAALRGSVESSLLLRIADAILAAPSVEEMEKNSAPTGG